MFEKVPSAPPDPILGLTEAYQQDAHAEKVNLTVGVYKDESGVTPILNCVREAEHRLLTQENTKAYLGIAGFPDFQRHVQDLLFGSELQVQAATVQTPGGTAALRVAADFIKQHFSGMSVWLSDPTWANHANVFHAAGLQTDKYTYFDAAANQLDIDGMLQALENIPNGHAVLLHACCHNPTGVDPSLEQWEQITDVVVRRGLLPVVDFAYQGFGDGLEDDAAGLRLLMAKAPELLICNSFSKNFGLYRERVGAMTVVASSSDTVPAAFSQIKRSVRANYSNPPAHGAAIVSTILADAALWEQWEVEVAQMRERIQAMRDKFVETTQAMGAPVDFSFLQQQRGMFSFSGLTPLQVDELRHQHAIYVVGSGRINVAGLTDENMDRVCRAIVAVLSS